MLWIPLVVILFIVASILFSFMDQHEESKLRRRYELEVERYKNRYSWEKTEGKDIPTVPSDEEISKEARVSTRKRKWLIRGPLIAAVLVLCMLNSFFTTNEQETAFTMTFGKATVVEGSGLHFKAPFITRAYVLDATTKGMAIGYNPESNESISEESLMITSDFNFVNTDFYVEYRISDPIEYTFGSDNPEGILRNIVQASIRNTVGLYGVDAVITTGRAEIQAVIKDQIIEKLEQHSTGLTLEGISIQDAEPPTAEVSKAFNEVETAKQNAETAVNNAQKSEKEKIPSAEAEADQIIKAAEAARTERINQAAQEVAEFNALFKEYTANPDTVKKQLYYSTMEEILPGMEIIIGNDSKVIYINNGEKVTAPTN